MTQHSINKNSRGLFLIIAGYIIIYGALELTAFLTGDLIQTKNALLVCLVVVVFAMLVEIIFFKSRLAELPKLLGFGKPSAKSMLAAIVIMLLLFLCYPLITAITGYQFKIPGSWVWLAVGVFALHGIAEEVLYRAYLFRSLRESYSFWKAAWVAVIFFTVAHLYLIFTQGIFVGGAAVILAVASSFPLSWLYEKGNNTIWAAAIVHFAIDTVIPILAEGGMDSKGQMAASLWMGFSMIIPFSAFLIIRNNKKNRI